MIAYPCEAQYSDSNYYTITEVDLEMERFRWQHGATHSGWWYMSDPLTRRWHLTNEL